MIHFLHLILIFFLSISSFAEGLSGKLNFKGPFKEVKPGDILRATLEITPYDLVGEIKKDELEGKKILKYFYVLEVTKVERNKNNSDVYLIDLSLVFLSPFKHTDLHLLELNKAEIPLSFHGITPVEDSLNPNSFMIFSHPDPKGGNNHAWWPYLLATLIVFPLFFIFGRRYFRKKQEKKRLDKQRQEMWHKTQQLFQQIESRSDVEKLYWNSQIWAEFYKGDENLKKSFLNQVNELQYQSTWTDEELKTLIVLTQKIAPQISTKQGGV